jgi:hypothetical protein
MFLIPNAVKLVFESGFAITGPYKSLDLIEIRCFRRLKAARVMNSQQGIVSRDLPVPNGMLAFPFVLMAYACLSFVVILGHGILLSSFWLTSFSGMPKTILSNVDFPTPDFPITRILKRRHCCSRKPPSESPSSVSMIGQADIVNSGQIA